MTTINTGEPAPTVSCMSRRKIINNSIVLKLGILVGIDDEIGNVYVGGVWIGWCVLGRLSGVPASGPPEAGTERLCCKKNLHAFLSPFKKHSYQIWFDTSKDWRGRVVCREKNVKNVQTLIRIKGHADFFYFSARFGISSRRFFELDHEILHTCSGRHYLTLQECFYFILYCVGFLSLVAADLLDRGGADPGYLDNKTQNKEILLES